MSGEFVVVYDLLPEIAAKIEETASKVVRKAAFDIVAHAQNNIRANGQVVTSFMMNSAYVEVNGGENEHPYSAVQEPEPGQTLLPEVDKPTEKTTAIIAMAASYAWYQEMGTMHMPPRPYFIPAVEKVKPQFERALDKIIELMNVSAVK